MRSHARLAAVAGFCLIIAAAPLASAQAADPTRTITVNGTGEAKAVPDQAQLSAGVTTTATTAAAALAENARKMNGVFATLKRLGVPDKWIQTSNFSVTPQYPPYNQNATGPQRIVGYQVSNEVDVTLDDVKKLGPALDALVGSGANQINSVGFSIRDPAALLATARAAAIADALKRAQTYTHAAGVGLGSVVSIQEGTIEPPRPMYRMQAVAMAPADVTPTAAGEQSVTANVTMVFELR
jgi:hypothetical protein